MASSRNEIKEEEPGRLYREIKSKGRKRMKTSTKSEKMLKKTLNKHVGSTLKRSLNLQGAGREA